jgi:uncharacterized protein YndB with AHSA1/START domain
MLIKILIGLAVVSAALVIVIAMQPADFRVARATTVAAPASDVFAKVNDFRKWPAWSPFEKLDPAMKKTYSGSPDGEGSIYTWSGNDKAGEGRTTIVETRPDQMIRMTLEFTRPFKVNNEVIFTFVPEGDRTSVTWAMTGHRNFMFKAVGLLMNMDKMVGSEFEQGLADLKSVSESSTPSPS